MRAESLAIQKDEIMNIYYSIQKDKFHARKQIDGKTTHIGYFDTIEEAQEAVDFFGQQEDSIFGQHEYVPPKQKRSELEGKPIEWLKEKSNQQIKELTQKYGPKSRR